MSAQDRFDVEPTDADRERVRDLLHRYGTNPNSFFVRYSGPWRFSFGRSVEGVVAYVRVGRTAMAWSDPLCAPENASALLAEFLAAAKAAKLRTSFLAVSEPVARAAMSQGCSVLAIGLEPAFDLETWHVPRGDAGKKVRWCVNHARKSGITVEEYRAYERRDPAIEREMDDVQRAWEARLGGKVVRSFLRSDPLEAADEKRIFLARRGDRLEAFLACAPVAARNGWYLEDMVRLPMAANGATELLVVEAMRRLKEEGARYATLGIAPLRGSERQIDRRARWLVPALRWAFEYFDGRYRFASLSRYKAKFGPSRWEPRYVALSPPWPSIGTIRAIISVLDPQPAETPPERAPRERVVVGQALVLALASLLVLAHGHLADDVWGTAGLIAPVGVAGILIATLLFATTTRARHGDGIWERAVAAGLEGILIFGALVRIHEGRWVPFELLAAGLAGTAMVLLLRRAPSHANAERSGG